MSENEIAEIINGKKYRECRYRKPIVWSTCFVLSICLLATNDDFSSFGKIARIAIFPVLIFYVFYLAYFFMIGLSFFQLKGNSVSCKNIGFSRAKIVPVNEIVSYRLHFWLMTPRSMIQTLELIGGEGEKLVVLPRSIEGWDEILKWAESKFEKLS
jgi:hypothetical protein